MTPQQPQQQKYRCYGAITAEWKTLEEIIRDHTGNGLPRNSDIVRYRNAINGYFDAGLIEKEREICGRGHNQRYRIRSRPHTSSTEAPKLVKIVHQHKTDDTDCIACSKPAIAYGIGKDEQRLVQCNTCMFDGKRECMYHGYPDETIPQSCEYKIGKYAIIAPIEAQLHNRQHDAAIRNATLDGIDREIMKKEEWTRMELLAIISQQKSLRSTTSTQQQERAP